MNTIPAYIMDIHSDNPMKDIVSIAYALWILRKTKRLDKDENRDRR